MVNIPAVVVLQRGGDTTPMKASTTLHQGRDTIVKVILIIPQDPDDATIRIIRPQEEIFKMILIIHPLGVEDKIICLQEELIEMILIIHLQDFTNWIIIVLK